MPISQWILLGSNLFFCRLNILYTFVLSCKQPAFSAGADASFDDERAGDTNVKAFFCRITAFFIFCS